MTTNLSEIVAAIPRVTMQLSNLCNYAQQHKLCPVQTFRHIEILPAKIVYDVIDTLAEYGFNRRRRKVCWHVFNEPLIDPRLMTFIAYLRRQCNKVQIQVWSNGWYLDAGLAIELVEAGMTTLTLSAYNENEYRRLGKIGEAIGNRASCDVHRAKLRTRVMATDEMIQPKFCHCHAPLGDLTIRASGQIGLCCLDWAEEKTFEDMGRKRGFAAALQAAYPEMIALQAELLAGERKMLVCRQCQHKR